LVIHNNYTSYLFFYNSKKLNLTLNKFIALILENKMICSSGYEYFYTYTLLNVCKKNLADK